MALNVRDLQLAAREMHFAVPQQVTADQLEQWSALLGGCAEFVENIVACVNAPLITSSTTDAPPGADAVPVSRLHEVHFDVKVGNLLWHDQVCAHHNDHSAQSCNVGRYTDKPCTRTHDDGWTISGVVIQDWASWVNDFVAHHPTLGRVEGNFESTVTASSKEAYEAFIVEHGPNEFDYQDI